ncbi:hypothetical protein B0H10DRAFT_2379916 [Mycena sp. CBHHK59/15]|nr:hypothetical protein B0H10DRAFT_2379916 [Mycena sp. CBHHK59/15]
MPVFDHQCGQRQTSEYFDELFTKIIAELRELLATMSLSTYSQDWGHTFTFATMYWSLDSPLRGIPAFVSIVRNPDAVIDSGVLQRHFSDDEDVFNFKRDLTRLGAVLMPFARAIQCLESKDTIPADTKDDNAGPKSKYETTVKELMRSIANFWFTQLIEDEQSSNVYFTVFVLDPDNRGASILATPNPLAVRPVAISFRGGEPTREYGNEYRPDRTVEQARTAMEEINPYIAQPADALRALKTQLKAFLNGDAPFDRKKKPNESARNWWMNLLNEKTEFATPLCYCIASTVAVCTDSTYLQVRMNRDELLEALVEVKAALTADPGGDNPEAIQFRAAAESRIDAIRQTLDDAIPVAPPVSRLEKRLQKLLDLDKVPMVFPEDFLRQIEPTNPSSRIQNEDAAFKRLLVGYNGHLPAEYWACSIQRSQPQLTLMPRPTN